MTDLSDIGMSTRLQNVLLQMGLHTLEEVATCSERDLMYQPNFGQVSLKEIESILQEHGLRLIKFKEVDSHKVQNRLNEIKRLVSQIEEILS